VIASATLVAVSAGVAWAALDVARKRLAASLHPAAVVIWLNGAAIPLFGGLAWATGGGWPPAAWWPWGLGAIALSVTAQVLYMESVRLGAISVVIPMLSLTPAYGALLDAAVFGETLTAAQVAGLAIVVVGSLANSALGDGLRLDRAAALMAVVGLLFAAQGLLDKGGLAHVGAATHATALCVGNVGLLLALLAARGRLDALRLPARLRPTLVAGVALVGVAYGLQLVALTLVPLGVVEGIKRGLSLPLSALAGVALFRETVAPRRMAVLAAMAAGVALLA
jgi:drug/metabolite transporter (DMT)-like permease